jgi:hypothetical protein
MGSSCVSLNVPLTKLARRVATLWTSVNARLQLSVITRNYGYLDVRHNFLVTMLTILGLICSCAAIAEPDKQNHSATLSVDRAAEIASKAFKKTTRVDIKKVSVTIGEEAEEYWVFLFMGKEDYARPGFHWLVKVNKATGKADVIPGE